MKVALLICFLLFATLLSAAQTDLLTFHDEETPVIEHTASTRDNRGYEYAEQYTDPGAVVYHDGQFHMFRNGFRGWPSRVWIHYMVSDDGISWEQPSETPVLLSSDADFATLAILASSVHVEEDGTWVLYFYTWNTPSFRSGKSEIGRATADNPAGPWTVDESPVLAPGEEGTWDDDTITAPLVLKTDDGYMMYYEGGAAGEAERSIGMATSDDGITWEKYAENPIMTVTEDWEGNRVHQPRVVQTDEGYLMIYRVDDTDGNNVMGLGLATSDDGITWEKSDANPVFTMDMVDMDSFWYTAMTAVEDTLYFYIEFIPGVNVTDIYVMTASITDLFDS